MTSDPRAVVEDFFDRMSDDDQRPTIGDLFADDAVIALPGKEFQGTDAPEEFLAFLAPRYEWADKEFDRWITTGNYVVSIGTLYGVDNAGDEFSDVRYVDIYEVEDGEIQRLDIFNDLAVDGVVEP
jgi:limonene-1,2-epoxide hydrolase